MPDTVTFTLRLPRPLKEGIERLSEATNRTKSSLCTQAIQEYLEAQEWQMQTIRAAVKKADSSDARFIPHEQVVKRMNGLSASRLR